jgi:hypothetical protein
VKTTKFSKGALALLAAVTAATTLGGGLPAVAAPAAPSATIQATHFDDAQLIFPNKGGYSWFAGSGSSFHYGWRATLAESKQYALTWSLPDVGTWGRIWSSGADCLIMDGNFVPGDIQVKPGFCGGDQSQWMVSTSGILTNKMYPNRKISGSKDWPNLGLVESFVAQTNSQLPLAVPLTTKTDPPPVTPIAAPTNLRAYESPVDAIERAVSIDGKAPARSTVKVTNADGGTTTTTAGTDGYFDVSVPAPKKSGVQSFSVTATLDNKTSSAAIASFDYGRSVKITAPKADAILGGDFTVTADSQNRAKVTVTEGDKTLASATSTGSTVDLDVKALGQGEHTLTVTQKSVGAFISTDTVKITVDAPIGITNTVPSTQAGKVSGWSTMSIDERVLGAAIVTAPEGTTIEQITSGPSASPDFVVSGDKKTATSSNEVTTWQDGFRTVQVKLRVGAGQTAGSTLSGGSVTIKAAGQTLATGPMQVVVAATPVVAPVALTGISFASSNSTKATATGTGNAGATITLSSGGKFLGTTIVKSDGTWTTTITAPGAGINVVTASQTAGGKSTTADRSANWGAGVDIVTDDTTITEGDTLALALNTQTGASLTVKNGSSEIAKGTATSGTHSFDVKNLAVGNHTLTVTQLSKGNLTTTDTVKITVTEKAVVVAPTVISPAEGSTVTTSRPVFTGSGQPGATMTIGYGPRSPIGTGEVAANGTWTITPTSGLALGVSKLIVTQVAGGNTQTVNHTVLRVAAVVPFGISSHANNQTYDTGVATFRGTGAEGAQITAKNQWGTPMGSAVVSQGIWQFSRNLGPTTTGYDLTFTQTVNGKSTDLTLHLVYVGSLAFQIESPTDGSTYTVGNTVFRGKAAPGTLVTAKNQWNTPMGTATAQLNGEWDFTRYLGPTVAGYQISFTATKGTDTQRTLLTLLPENLNAPVIVTSIGDGATYRPGVNTLKGTGTPGAGIAAVNATNGWNVPMGATTVAPNGTWALPERNWGPSNDYQIKVTQTNPDKSATSTTVTIKAPVFQAVTLIEPTTGDGYANGVAARFSGTATPYATITVRSAQSDSVYRTVEVKADGTWSFDRVWGPDHAYMLIIDQVALDGQTDSIDKFAWAPIA